MTKFKPLDFYKIDQQLTEEERLVRDTVRRFIDERCLPHIGEHFEKGTFPSELIPVLAEMGLLGMSLEGYGCAGMSYTQYGLVCQELERGDSGLRSFMSVQSSLTMFPIWAFGSETQKETYLPKLARGEWIGCFGLTEPDAGSDPNGMTTTAKRTDEGWRIHGTKMWITNGTVADIAVIWAHTDEGIRGFLIEKGTQGFSAPEMKGKMSLRASVTSELVMDNVLVPHDNILPKSKGLGSAYQCLNSGRYGISWGAIGAANACYSDVLNYVLERKQFKKPLAAFQLIQNKLAWMATEITKMQLIALQLGRLMDNQQHDYKMISLAKMNNVSTALEIARVARDMMGANGISLEYSPMRHACNLEAVNTYEGTHDIHRLILGEAITGIPAYS